MKKLYIEPSADIHVLKPSDIITTSPTAIEDEGDTIYVGYKDLTWTSEE